MCITMFIHGCTWLQKATDADILVDMIIYVIYNTL